MTSNTHVEMILDKIYNEVAEYFCFDFRDGLTQNNVAGFIKNKYPGNYSVDVAEDIVFSLIFDTPEDMTLFILRYS